MNETSAISMGPIMQLVANGLKLWIQSKCDSIGELRLKLHGSAIGLLKGQLSGVSLFAEDVSYKGISFCHAELNSGPLKLNINFKKNGQMVKLEKAFKLKGYVSITEEGLNSMLLSKQWRWLGDWLTNKLMNLTPLKQLSISNDLIELEIQAREQEIPARSGFLIKASQGKIKIYSQDSTSEAFLPMDPSVQIELAELIGSQLNIKGLAIVNP